MQLLVALAVVLAYLSGDPALAQCPGVSSFSAYTFDVLNHVPSRSYHAVPEGLTLYENALDDGETLYDFNTGTIYFRNADGSCFKYQSYDFAFRDPNRSPDSVSPPSLLFTATDKSGVTRTCVQFTVGNLTIRNVMTDDCFGDFISFTFKGVQRFSYFFVDPEPLTDAEVQKSKDALEKFVADKCPAKCL